MAQSSSSNDCGCQESMTRGQLLALRNSSQLEPECHYTITDYNRGTVGAAEIQLHAVDVDELSMDVSVDTTFDNISWDGRYDIDTNRLHELSDNIGNVVSGDAAVDGFPWGVAAVNENTVHEGVVNYTSGTMIENDIRGATVTISGTANLTRNIIEQSANLVISGAAILAESTLQQDANVTLINGNNFENRFGTSCAYNQVGTGFIRYSQIDGNGTITNGDVNINSSTFEGATAMNTTGSAGSIDNTVVGYANLNSLQNIPFLRFRQGEITSGSTFTCNGATRVDLYRFNVESGGRILVAAGTTLNSNYSSARDYGYIQVTAGTLTANYAHTSSLGYISHQSTGTNSVDRVNVTSQANMRFLNTATGGRIYYSEANSGATIYQNGTNLNSYQYYCKASSLSQVYQTNCTTARHYYNSADAYSYIRAYGTNPGQSIMYYCNATARGYIDHTNINNRIRFYSVDASAQSIIRQTGSTANANLYYSSATAYYYMLLVLTGGTRSALHGYGRQNFNGMPPTNGAAVRNF